MSAVNQGLALQVSGCSSAPCAPQSARLATGVTPVAPLDPLSRTGRVGERDDSYESTITDPTDPAADDASSADPVADDAPVDDASAKKSAAPDELTADELQLIRDLERRDRDVRAHEAAHQSAGAGLVGGASYSFQAGPDGQRYAIGGEVSVDVSAEAGDPAATISKMQRVRAAALAPADPSGQDLAVASAAAQILAAAQQEVARQRSEGEGKDQPADQAQTERKTEHKTEANPEQKDPSAVELMGAKPTEFAAILGNEQRQRWVQMAFGERPSSGTFVDQSA